MANISPPSNFDSSSAHRSLGGSTNNLNSTVGDKNKNPDLVEKDWNSDDGIFDRLLRESLCLGLGMGQDHSQQLFNTGEGADK